MSLLVLNDYSLEMTGKDVDNLQAAHEGIPLETRINVTFLGNEDLQMRLMASRAVQEFGFVPVPHISARRLASQAMLEEFLTALQAEDTVAHVFSVGGDPAIPDGPYSDSTAIR